MSHNVSVIIPVYNGETYLAEALASAQAQTTPPYEIIVVDDGSTDRSAEIARGHMGVQYVRQENAGISAARNRGLERARGDLFALLDADDVWLPGKLEKQVAALANETAPAFVFGHVEEFVSPELPAEVRAQLSCEPASRAGVLPSGMLITRAAFRRVGPFATQWHAGEFADWVLRANEAGLKKIMLPDLLVRRRIHMRNNGIRQRQKFNDYARIIKASLDRRRAAGQDAA